MHGRDEKFIQNLVGKPERKRPLGRDRCRWEENIKMNLKDTGRGLDLSSPGYYLVAGSGDMIMNFWVP
jgi:hypothetical protein